MKRMLGLIPGILLTGLSMSFAGVALADGPQAVATAAQHAGLAAGSDVAALKATAADVQMMLQG